MSLLHGAPAVRIHVSPEWLRIHGVKIRSTAVDGTEDGRQCQDVQMTTLMSRLLGIPSALLDCTVNLLKGMGVAQGDRESTIAFRILKHGKVSTLRCGYQGQLLRRGKSEDDAEEV